MDWQRLDPEVHAVRCIADQWARESGAAAVWAEDVLLVLLRRPRGGVAGVFQSLHLDLEQLVSEVRAALPKDRGPAGIGKLPMMKSAHEVFDAAVAEAQSLGHALAGTEHLLLGFLCTAQCAAAKILASWGATVDAVRWQIVRLPRPLPADNGGELAKRQRRAQLEEEHRVRQLQDYTARRDESQSIRRLIGDVIEATKERRIKIAPDGSLGQWLEWAQRCAAQLDPVDEVLSQLSRPDASPYGATPVLGQMRY